MRDIGSGSTADDSGVPAWPVAGVVFAVLWLLVRGVEPSLDAVVGQFLLGLLVGLPIAFVFRRLYAPRVDLSRVARAVPSALRYLGAFAAELVRANLDVAYRVLAPDPAIEPEVVLVPLRVRTAAGITLIANSITITPGTLTLDHDAERNALYVHAIDGRDPEAIVAPIRTWEDYALEIFDEELSPADPAPEIVITGPGAESGDRADGAEPENETGSTERGAGTDPTDGTPPDDPSDGERSTEPADRGDADE